MKKDSMKNLVFIYLTVIGIVSLLAVFWIFPKLPEEIPIHWGIYGNVDRYAPKNIIYIFAALPILIPIGMDLFKRIDPKRNNYEKFQSIYEWFAVGLTLLMILIVWLTIGASLNVFNLDKTGTVVRIICITLGVFSIILGNYMPRVKQNWFFGIKTPWALSNKNNWQKTQRMGGIYFILLGVLLILNGIFLNTILPVVFIVYVIFGLLFLYGYSYWLSLKETE